MSASIQGLPLEVTVVGCNKLKDTEWISRQDPYVCLEYATSKFRTRTCTDGHKTPVFQEKFVIPMIEGLREINVIVWNSNTLSTDDFIGSGRIQLQKVLSQGYDDNVWAIQSKRGRYAGEVRLIMHFQGANRTNAQHFPPTAMPAAGMTPYVPAYSTPSPAAASYNPSAYSSVSSQTPYGAAYPAPQTNQYPYAPTAYSQPPPTAAYPPQPYPPSTYPPATYPPSNYPSAYPPQSSTYPPNPFPGLYPPPPRY